MRNHVQYSEILNTHNKSGLKGCLFHGKVECLYDPHCKGYLLNLDSGSLTIPKSSRETLELVRPYILLQLFIYPGKLLTIEFSTTDSSAIKRRLIFTQGKEIIKNVMHARIPHSMIIRNSWINLSFDVSSIFTLCFPSHSFRSIDSIYISGTLKIRRIVSLMIPARDILPSISELPKFKIELQEIDASSLPRARPLYFSNSPVKVNKKYYKNPIKNIFGKQQESANDLRAFKKEYIRSINIGPKWLFGSPKKKEKLEKEQEGHVSRGQSRKNLDKELARKITHNHSRNENYSDDEVIEESIEADKKSWVDMLSSNSPPKPFNSPDYYSRKLSQLCQVRHFTPPFVNSKDNITYAAADRYYDNLKDDYKGYK